ncbi:hypothetical protein GCM10029963_35540 [Micromonospora andamanensis]
MARLSGFARAGPPPSRVYARERAGAITVSRKDVEQAAARSPGQDRVGRVGLVGAGVVVAVEAFWLVLGLPAGALVSDLGALTVAGWARWPVSRRPAGIR